MLPGGERPSFATVGGTCRLDFSFSDVTRELEIKDISCAGTIDFDCNWVDVGIRQRISNARPARTEEDIDVVADDDDDVNVGVEADDIAEVVPLIEKYLFRNFPMVFSGSSIPVLPV